MVRDGDDKGDERGYAGPNQARSIAPEAGAYQPEAKQQQYQAQVGDPAPAAIIDGALLRERIAARLVDWARVAGGREAPARSAASRG